LRGQAAAQMPPGRYVCDDYRYVIPAKEDTLKDIESLIHHFINVTRGPKIPKGEAYAATEVPRGEQGYYVVSDGLNTAYRMRIRGPGFANVQAMPLMTVGGSIPDLIATIGLYRDHPASVTIQYPDQRRKTALRSRTRHRSDNHTRIPSNCRTQARCGLNPCQAWPGTGQAHVVRS